MKKIFDIDNYDAKEYGKSVLSKMDYDLFDESKHTVEKIIRVKRFQVPNNGEKWKIFENNKVLFVVEGSKLSKKEKEFLRTADGFNFLIKLQKEELASLKDIKSKLKLLLK